MEGHLSESDDHPGPFPPLSLRAMLFRGSRDRRVAQIVPGLPAEPADHPCDARCHKLGIPSPKALVGPPTLAPRPKPCAQASGVNQSQGPNPLKDPVKQPSKSPADTTLWMKPADPEELCRRVRLTRQSTMRNAYEQTTRQTGIASVAGAGNLCALGLRWRRGGQFKYGGFFRPSHAGGSTAFP